MMVSATSSGRKLTAVDIFAGAGGFSLGAVFAGCNVSHCIEIDEWACDTLRLNHPETEVIQADFRSLDENWVAKNLPMKPDLLIGGPPCQGFSHAAVGRQDPKDPRNSLFREFVRAARILEPRVVIVENVPGLLRTKTEDGESVRDIIESELTSLGFNVNMLVLEAERYGVPQIRRRVFFIGLADGTPPSFIEPTHSYGDSILDHFLPPVRTVRDAIGDLPIVDVGDTADPVALVDPPTSDFQRLMRGTSTEIFNHVPMRHSKRLIERFKFISSGQSQSHVPDEHAPWMRVRTGSPGTFDQNNRRMFWDRPCHTLAASFYANFLHPSLNRNFTAREGARIQTFPDWYRFLGKPTVVSQKLLAREGRDAELHLCQYNQIGNAVPPLLAEVVVRAALNAANLFN